MTMMKDLYDEGDDNMKKIIGEAMYKARRDRMLQTSSNEYACPYKC